MNKLLVRTLQDHLVMYAKELYRDTPISSRVIDAFYSIPRHAFISKYRSGRYLLDWFDVDQKNPDPYLEDLYADHPLVIYDDGNFVSTISQPSFVLRILDLLQLRSGDKVFELGTGSGWNAALMGKLVGPEGHVVSMEIIPDLIFPAKQMMKCFELQNVEIIGGDAGDGYALGAPFDKVIFTAGANDLPPAFFSQIKLGGLLFFILRSKVGPDDLILLEKCKREDGVEYFESLTSIPCSFVPLRGKYEMKNGKVSSVKDFVESHNLETKEVEKLPFSIVGFDEDLYLWDSRGLCYFLSISESGFENFDIGDDETSFGLWEEDKKSLVVFKDSSLYSFGNTSARDALLERINNWVDLGMPDVTRMSVQIFPTTASLEKKKGSWIAKKTFSQFMWTLK